MRIAHSSQLTVHGEKYPENLAAISGAPKKLYVFGKLLKRDRRAVAIVGSRHMTDYGKKVAYNFAKYLASHKITIVSGLARGIDTVAHKGALAASGRTIAVLGHGLDRIYPPENRELAKQIAKNGALITEFPEGTSPIPKNFLARNRIISGLALGILVVEGARRSGTLSIANWAANQNREVFAVPGRLDSPTSHLPNFLINEGAIVANRPQDILEYLGL